MPDHLATQRPQPLGAVWPPVSRDPGLLASSDDSDTPQLDGYRLLESLGQGGMGTVWKATQLSSSRTVALKLIRGGFFGSPLARARFDREVELLARLEHPHIARLYHSGVCQGTPFYSMELVEGVSLDAYVRSESLSRDSILDLVARIARATDYAHRKGVIHRDLKPSNILVDTDGAPRIVDFGLGKLLQMDPDVGPEADLSRDGTAAGTLEYMSPEQAAGQLDRIDRGTDVYSLGVILYQLLTDRLPHGPCPTPYALQQAIVEEEPHRPRAVARHVDAELEALLLKALAKDPADRYASAAALAEDIESYRRGEPLRARPLTIGYLVRKRMTRYRRSLTAVALVLLLLVGAGAGAWRMVTAAEEAAFRSRQFEEHARYTNHINLAANELQRQDPAKAADLLDQAPPSLRAWEWRHLRHRADGSRLTIDDPTAQAIRVTPDGRRILTAQPGGFVAQYSTSSGQPLPPIDFRDTWGPVIRMAGDGGAFLVDRGDTLTVLTPDGEPLRSHPKTPDIVDFALSPSGSWLATVDAAGTLRVSGPGPGDRWETAQPRFSEISWLRLADDGTVAHILEMMNPQHYSVRVIRPGENGPRMISHSTIHALNAMAILPDGSAIAVAGDDALRLIATETGEEQWTAALPPHVTGLAAPAGGGEVWVATQAGVVWFDAATGARLGEVLGLGPASGVRLAGDPAGRFLIAGGRGQIKLWHRGDQPVVAVPFPVREPAVSAFWSGPAVLTVAGVLGSVFEVSAGGSEIISQSRGERYAISAAGARTAAGKPLVVTEDGRVGRAAPAGVTWLGRLGGEGSGRWAACFDPNGRWLLAQDERGRLVSWNVATAAVEPLAAPPAARLSIPTDVAGKRLLLVDRKDQSLLRFCDAASLKPIVTKRLGSEIRRVALSGDGEVAAALLEGGGVVVLDDSGAVLSRFQLPGQTGILTLDHGGTRLATGDRIVTLYNTFTGQPIYTIESPDWAHHAVFSPDDTALAIVGSRQVTLWRGPY